MSKFHSLIINKINQLTNNAIEISFDISNTDYFSFISGQYITVKHQINNEDVRRAYSICSSPSEGLSIGVKLVGGGKMSSFLTKELKEGDMLEVMPPSGNFVINANKNNNIVGICAGSGITPVLSMIKSILSNNSERKVTLIFGNQSQESTMFLEQLRSIEQESSERLKIHWLFSREKVHSSINGRIDKNTLQQLLNTFSELKSADDYFLCGPGELIDNTQELLLLNNINKSKIHFERFSAVQEEGLSNDSEEIISNVMLCVDGEDFEFTLSNKGQTILDAAMEHGADVPFSCKGAVCCTCKAKVMAGKVTMDANYSLSEEEVAEGYILGCQSHPASENVVIDFDEM
jgi:ring-1,2-phenylacetyl-CoA epoxidase subunit PaaE